MIGMKYSLKAYVLLGFFCFTVFLSKGQDQKLADSLRLLYESGSFESGELELLSEIAIEETNLDKKLSFSNMLIVKAERQNAEEFLYQGYLQKGNALQFKGNNTEALRAYLRSLEYAEKTADDKGIGSLMISIADVYSMMDNSGNALQYYDKGIRLLRKVKDSIKIATALLNTGDHFFNTGLLDSALVYTEESGMIFENMDYPIGKAYSLGNIGMIYAEKGNDPLAEQNMNEAIMLLEELEDYYPISVYLTYMSDIYKRKGDADAAINYARRSLDLASEYGLKEQISDAHLTLSDLYEGLGDLENSLKHYRDHIAYRDSVINVEKVQQLADLRTNYEVSQKQVELDLADQRRINQRNISIATGGALVLIGLFAIGLYRRNNFIRKTKKIIEEEKERSDQLLLNILPEETAQELKENGRVKARKYESVTVLFTDFKGFTSYSENLSPEDLVKTVDFYFSKFDAITEKYGLEKIKTIGDAYMCVGGLHDNAENHASRMVSAALEIVAFVEDTKNDVTAGDLTFDIRIGINTGPAVAGVVGTHKFAYDIWGDTVNVAARMESMSEPGRINISEHTYTLVREEFTCNPRGEIDVKNRGQMKMYFVEGRKTATLA
jgi:class 3 adenylate cyclase